MLTRRAIRQFTLITLMVIPLTSCLLHGDRVTWEYTIPDGYNGWLAIQYNCPGGQPLNRKDDVIKVTFGPDGLFCTSDSSFAWNGKERAKNTSGTEIRVFGSFPPNQVYGVCCGSAYSASIPSSNGFTNIVLTLMWVGTPQNGAPQPNLDAINKDMEAGQLVPADW